MRSAILDAATSEELIAKIDTFLDEHSLDNPEDIAAISYSFSPIPAALTSVLGFFRETPPHAHHAIIVYRQK